ncbi:MAG: glycosyltransferase [Phycisphaerales bacterium]|nr:glycosyltransferase [Phycisphaerales bacterium]
MVGPLSIFDSGNFAKIPFMKIAFVVTSFPTLAGTPIMKQITKLIDRGHEVDIYGDRPGALSKLHPDVERYRLLNQTHCPSMPRHLSLRLLKGVGLFLAHVWKNPAALLQSLNFFKYGELAASMVLLYSALPLLRGKAYDIIHCQFGPNGLKGLFLRENGLLQGKWLTTFRGYDLTSYPRRRGNDVYRRLFQECPFFTANSSFLAAKAVKMGCPSDKITVLHTGVNMARFAYRERRLKPGESVRVLTVGSLVEVKGIEYGIRAIAQVSQKYPKIQYRIAGGGPLMTSLRDLTRELGVSERVELLGGQTEDEIIEHYADAHVFLFPGVVSRRGDEEGMAGACVEAQATGLPVVATRVGGIPEAVLDGQSGFLVEPKDVSALADRLIYLIEHPECRSRMGRAGREHVERHYDLDKLIDRLIGIYGQLIEGVPPDDNRPGH